MRPLKRYATTTRKGGSVGALGAGFNWSEPVLGGRGPMSSRLTGGRESGPEPETCLRAVPDDFKT